MKISVIVPVYNCAKYLSKCLDSLATQTFRNFEVICINDGSKDDSLAILNSYSLKDKRFRVFSTQNRGQGATRNLGMKYAKGEYIYFMDGDDMLDPKTLEICYSYLLAKRLDLIMFDAETVYETEVLEKKFHGYKNAYKRSREYNQIYNGIEIFNKLVNNNDYFVSPCLFMCSRALIERHNIVFPEGIIYEDNVFTYQLILSANRVSHIQKKLYKRNLRSGSTVTNPLTVFSLCSYMECASEIFKFSHNQPLDYLTQLNTIKILETLKNNVTAQAHVLKKNSNLSPLDNYLIKNCLRLQPNFLSRCATRVNSALKYEQNHGMKNTLSKIMQRLR